jgi:Predicted pyridoxal phosphate-dependent enzyme apparently involved in regulation of cell wall biogenesis
MPAVNQVFEDQAFILGPRVAQAEEAFARFLEVEHALGVSSGTDAILLSLMALGVGPGDGVITTPFTFFATVGCIVRLGAVPMFVDIDPVTYNLDPAKLNAFLERGDFPAPPKVLMPVHLFGQPADMAPIIELAQDHGLKLVGDAAQAIGAAYPLPGGEASRQVSALGNAVCFSFFPSKNLGAAGDGGLITTQDGEFYARLKSMRTHGSHPDEKYRHIYVGGNFRLDALQPWSWRPSCPIWRPGARPGARNADDYERLFTEAGLVEAGQ